MNIEHQSERDKNAEHPRRRLLTRRLAVPAASLAAIALVAGAVGSVERNRFLDTRELTLALQQIDELPETGERHSHLNIAPCRTAGSIASAFSREA